MYASEKLESIGEADILIFAGILGYYGVIPFSFCMAVTMGTAFIYFIIYYIIHHADASGIALLPSILISAPLRICVYINVCMPMVKNIIWAVKQIPCIGKLFGA
jgi:hypothetical protein